MGSMKGRVKQQVSIKMVSNAMMVISTNTSNMMILLPIKRQRPQNKSTKSSKHM
jgi:hypothetical protein